MKSVFLSLLLLLLLPLTACHQIDSYSDSQTGNFNQLWKIVDEHYCFFAEKGVDWDEVYSRYRPRVSDKMSDRELFDVCAAMLDELRDGHVNLSAPFNTSYYKAWWTNYPQNFTWRIIEQNYFNFQLQQASGISYGLLPENVGYIRYSSFSMPIGEGNLDQALAFLATASGLIIDIRDNGGGSMDNVHTLVGRFIDAPILAGYISHKTGPGHNDFSTPEPYTYNPAQAGRQRWLKPVVVLTNRSTFSAANNFASVMRLLPQVMLVGDVTGGGSGMPFSSELSNGWGVRFSACSVLDAQRQTTEQGVAPTPDCRVDLDPQQALQGHDSILDFAINLLTNN